jgi:flagellar hook-associated protein 2
MLDDIETDFGLTVGSLTISDGNIVVTDDTTGVSQLGISFTFDSNAGSLSFGTFASQYTGIANGAKAGIDVAGTINGEAATGTGQLLRGDDPGDGSSSVEDLAIKVTSTSESLTGSVANTASSSVITSTTLFSAIDSASVVDNDTITISGMKHDGSAVSYTYTVTAANQVEDLLDDIENNFGLTAGSVTIDSSGKIAISDTFSGDSQLSITLTENNEGSGSLNFGDIIPGDKDTIELTMGVAETMYNKLLVFTDSIDGLLTIRIDGLGDTVDNLQETIDGMNERLSIEALMLNNKFVQLELSLSKLQSLSNFLATQLSQLSK